MNDCNVCLVSKKTTKCSNCVFEMCDECIITNSKHNNIKCPYCLISKKIKIVVDNTEIPDEDKDFFIEKYIKKSDDLLNYKCDITLSETMYNNDILVVIYLNHNDTTKIIMKVITPIKNNNLYNILFGKRLKLFSKLLLLTNIVELFILLSIHKFTKIKFTKNILIKIIEIYIYKNIFLISGFIYGNMLSYCDNDSLMNLFLKKITYNS